MRNNAASAVLVCLWAILVAGGFFRLWGYGATPGASESPPKQWPAAARVVHQGRPTLLLFAHPMCACTKATLTELENLLAACGNRLDAHVVFIAPLDADDSWQQSEIVSRARTIQGVTTHSDWERSDTHLFGARTSGTCLLYDRQGKLIFHGGLTAARGEIGDNDGRRALENLAQDKSTPIGATPSFGCPLFEPNIKP